MCIRCPWSINKCVENKTIQINRNLDTQNSCTKSINMVTFSDQIWLRQLVAILQKFCRVKVRFIDDCVMALRGTLHKDVHGRFRSTVIKLKVQITNGVFFGHPDITGSLFIFCRCSVFLCFIHDIDLFPLMKNSDDDVLFLCFREDIAIWY